MLEIKSISAIETYQIRKVVFLNNLDLPVNFKGDNDSSTFHLGGFKASELIAVASFIKTVNTCFSGSQFQLRGMAVIKKYQGYGFGNQLLEKGIFILKDMKIDLLWCNARIPALYFYKRKGFQTVGEEFMIENIGQHFKMFKQLK